MILLDTHAAVWLVTDDRKLGAHSRALAASSLVADQLVVSAISFWEIALLIARDRLEWRDQASNLRIQVLATGVRELPLSGDVAVLAVELKGLHSDPADRFIAATAIVHGATLVTADANLLRWRHKLRRQNASK